MADIVNINQSKIDDEEDDEMIRNTILYPILKSYLEKYPQHHDAVVTFEQAIENIKDVFSFDQMIDIKYELQNDKYAHFKLHMSNPRIYDSDSPEMQQYSNFHYNPTPNHALMNKRAYTFFLISDVNYSLHIYYDPSNFD